MMSPTILAELSLPYIVIESTFESGVATALAISGSALTSISVMAASPYFFIASAFLSRPSASAKSFNSIALASASPLA